MNNLTNDKFKIKPKIFRIISFVVLYGIFGVGNYYFLRSYITFFLLIIFALLPFISYFMLKNIVKGINIKLYKSDEHIEVNSLLGIGLIIDNQSYISALNLKCFLTISNLFYNEKCEQIISVPIIAKSKNTNPIICEASSCGTITVDLNKSELTDMFGLFACHISVKDSVSINVYPKRYELDDSMRLGILSGFSDNEDDSKKGNEYSDTSNIREYIPGDRIKDIHWKLSSKRDILLVREHIKTCENKLLLWIDRSPRKKNNELILKYALAVMNYCLAEGVYLKAMWLSKDNQSIVEATVTSTEQLHDAFVKLYLDSTIQSMEDIKHIVYGNNIKTNTLLRVGFKESEVTIYAYEI